MNILLVVDTRNIFNTLQRTHNNGKLDYKSFIETVAGPDHIYTAIAYGCRNGDKTIGFITLLEKLGFTTKFSGYDAGSPNVQLTIDVVRFVLGGKIDRVILASSDHDLVDLVYWVREQGLPCDVSACRIPKVLKDAASNITELNTDLLLK